MYMLRKIILKSVCTKSLIINVILIERFCNCVSHYSHYLIRAIIIIKKNSIRRDYFPVITIKLPHTEGRSVDGIFLAFH